MFLSDILWPIFVDPSSILYLLIHIYTILQFQKMFPNEY